MAENIGKLVATAGLDINPFEQSARVLQKQVRSLNQHMKSTEATFKNQGNIINNLKTKHQILGQQIKTAEALADKQRRTYEKQKAAVGDLSTATDKEKESLLKAETAMHKADAQAENLQRQFKELEKELLLSSNSFVKAGTKMQDVGTKMQSAGKQMSAVGKDITTKVSLPIAAGLGIAVKKAADFESRLSSIEAVSGASSKEMEKFKNLAIDLGAKTKYSADEAAQGIEELLKAGVSTSDILGGALAGSLDLATAGELDLKSAAEIASTALNAFKDDSLSVTQAADLLAGAANASATDVNELKAGLSQTSAVASGVGLSFDDTATTLAVFAQNGLKGSDAGTSLKTMLMRLHPQTDKAWAEFERLGLVTTNTESAMKTLRDNGIKPLSNEQDVLMEQMHDLAKSMAGPKASASKVKKAFNDLLEQSGTIQSAFYDTNGELKSMDEIADILQDSLKGMTNEQKTAALTTMFGTDAVRGATIAYKEGGKGFKKMNSEMKKVTAAEVAAKKMDNLKGKVEELMGSLETLAISAGDTLIPMLSDGVKFIQKLVDKFNKLSPETQKTIVKFALLGAAIGPVTAGLGSIINVGGAVTKVTGLLFRGFGKLSVNAKLAKGGVDVLSNGSKALAPSIATATKGTGLFSSAIGFIANPAGAAVLALGGIGLAVYALKKEYDENKDTVNLWGAEVPKQTEKVLTNIQDLNQTASGEFELMKQGLGGSSDQIVKDFQKIGTSIENDLKAKITGIDEMIKKIPEASKEAAEKAAENEKKRINKNLTNVENNNKKIAEIKKAAADSEYGMTQNQLKRIQSLTLDSTKEYLNVTISSQKDRKTILAAMTGDVSKASQEQANAWAQSLGKQRQSIKSEYSEARKAIEKQLKELGYALDSEFAKDMFKSLKNGSKDATESIDKQLTAIAEKYPEVAEEIMFANGQMINSTDEWANEAKKSNKEIIDSASKLAESSFNVSESLRYVGEEANSAGAIWNSIVLDPKTGLIKTNALEQIGEASKQEGVWNKLKFMAKEGLLSTNVKTALEQAEKQKLTGWDAVSWVVKNADISSNEKEILNQILKDKNENWDPLKYFIKNANLDTNSEEIMKLIKVAKSQGWDVIPEYSEKDWILFTNALRIREQLREAIKDWDSIPSRDKKTLEIAYKTSGKGPSGILGLATGTNNHSGGLALVNDAKDSRYEELITLPNGRTFLPKGKNVLLDLPRGTQVLRGDKTAKLLDSIPKFADGTSSNFMNTRGMRLLSKMNMSTPVAVNSVSAKFDIDAIVKVISEGNLKQVQLLSGIIKAITGLTIDKDSMLAYTDSKQSSELEILLSNMGMI
ncbi:phage tail tape measure protein [Listeria monocytogenes]|nr:phage tail tape measure protein [Listeria monocytogenes]